jgi:MarR family transcriptional regulator, organic hydroperoxide resistance regulator
MSNGPGGIVAKAQKQTYVGNLKPKSSRSQSHQTANFFADDNGPLSYLVLRTAKNHRALAASLLRPMNLYPGQEVLLMELWNRDKQSQTELMLTLDLDASTVTKMVQRLVLQGLLTKSASETDRRSIVVSLSSKGKKLRSEVAAMWATLESSCFVELSEIERTSLMRLLDKTNIAIHNARARIVHRS